MLGGVAASIADQGVASATNFLLNIFLARWLTASEYGAYSVSWSILIVLAALHNALILEPMTVIGPAEYGTQIQTYLHSTRRLNWLVVLPLSVIALLIGLGYQQPSVRATLFVMAAGLPGYLLLLMLRRRWYVLNQPVRALKLSVLYALGVFAYVFLCRQDGKLTAVTASASFGVAWIVGYFGKSSSEGRSIRLRLLASEHWHYGKWLFASAILAAGVSDIQTIMLSMLVDLKSAGALRALMNFVVPLSQLLTVLSVYALPRLSARAKQMGPPRFLRWSIPFPAAMIVVAGAYLAVLLLFGSQIEYLLYGEKMRAYLSLVPLLAASAFVSGVGASFSTVLRAIQNSRHQFIAGVTATAVGVASAFYLLRPFGVSGALWSMLAANASSTLIIITFFVRFNRGKSAPLETSPA